MELLLILIYTAICVAAFLREPQLASPVDQPPEGKHWIHEIKHDGYRSQVLLERGQTHTQSPNERSAWSI